MLSELLRRRSNEDAVEEPSFVDEIIVPASIPASGCLGAKRSAPTRLLRTPSGLLAVPGEPLVGKPKFRTPLSEQ
eukprot:scaffold107964_cov59-Phaeocystis_antarctica.AAC.2